MRLVYLIYPKLATYLSVLRTIPGETLVQEAGW